MGKGTKAHIIHNTVAAGLKRDSSVLGLGYNNTKCKSEYMSCETNSRNLNKQSEYKSKSDGPVLATPFYVIVNRKNQWRQYFSSTVV